MAQTTICIRIDDKLKKDFEKFCDSVGMSMSTGINIFIKNLSGNNASPSKSQLKAIRKKNRGKYSSRE